MVAANRELPASGYALEVDGRLKAEFATKDGAPSSAAFSLAACSASMPVLPNQSLASCVHRGS
jgi:hypothetical protein